MECLSIREALSAQLDGEAHALPESIIDAHCELCAECRWWQQQVHTLHRQVRVAPAVDVPNLTPAIIQAIDGIPLPSARRERALDACRVLLAACATLQLLMTLPVLFGGDSGPVHLDHELGSWDLALGAGLLFAAARPARAWGMLPLVMAVALALTITAVVDVASGHTTLAAESGHLLEAIGVAFLWNIARLARATPVAPPKAVIQLV
jgi:predicted anti-sigma-YlaC factor YlaD